MPVAPQGKSAVQLDQELRRQKEALTKQSNLALRNSLVSGILGETAKTAGVEFVQRTMEEKMPTAEESLMATRRDYAAAEADWLGLGRAEEDERDRERIAGYRQTGDPYAVAGWLSPEDRRVFDKQEELFGHVRQKEHRVSELQKKITKIDWQLDEINPAGPADGGAGMIAGNPEHARLWEQRMALEEQLADARGEYETIQGMVEAGKIPEKRAEMLNRAIEKQEKLAAEKAKRRGQRFRMPRSGEQIQTPLGQRGKSRPPARRGGGAKAPQGRIPARLLSPWMKAEETMNDLKGRGASDPAARRNHANAVMRIARWVKDQGGEFALSSGEKNKFAKVMASNHITPSDAAKIRDYLAGASSDPAEARSQVALRNVLGTGPEATTSGEALGILARLSPPGFNPGDLLAPSPALTMAKIRRFLDGAVNRGALAQEEVNGHMKTITLEFQDALRKEGYDEKSLFEMLAGGR